MVFEDIYLGIIDFYLIAQGKNSLNSTDGKRLRTEDPKSLKNENNGPELKLTVLVANTVEKN